MYVCIRSLFFLCHNETPRLEATYERKRLLGLTTGVRVHHHREAWQQVADMAA